MPTASKASLCSFNPADSSDLVGEVNVSSPEDVRAAFERARQASQDWRSLTGPARADHLYAWADRIRTRQDDLAIELCREVGKPIGEARGEVARCVAILRYYAGECVRPIGEIIPSQFGGATQFSRRSPLGVVGLITPWNFPLAIPIWKAAPALAYGNVVVLKPSELSPVMGMRLAETASSLPEGVFQVVQGSREVGTALLEQESLAAVSFTGSVATGEIIANHCVKRHVRYQTEMGGKNVGIVLADADLDRAAALIASGAMRFAGQKCTATSRVVVIESVADAFLSKLIEATRALPVQNPMEPTCAVGPVISEASKDRIDQFVASAGEPVYRAEDIPSKGRFVAPVIFDRVAPDSTLAQEEIFGPVLAVMRAKDFDEAISLANATKFGLSAALYSSDLAAALRYIDRIEVGMVRVNGDTTGVDPHAPFGGYKLSSSGTREQGQAAIEFFTQTQTVQILP